MITSIIVSRPYYNTKKGRLKASSRRALPISVTDLVLLVLRLLRRDLGELAGSIEPVDLYNEG